MSKKIGIRHDGKGVIPFHEHQTNTQLNIKPGLNEVDIDLFNKFKKRILENSKLVVLEEMHEVPSKKAEAKEPASKKDVSEVSTEDTGAKSEDSKVEGAESGAESSEPQAEKKPIKMKPPFKPGAGA